MEDKEVAREDHREAERHHSGPWKRPARRRTSREVAPRHGRGRGMADVIEKKEGRDKEARRWPVKQFAEEAHEHIALFDHETRQQIQEYCELVARLPYDDDAPLGV